jgi:PleD family two-component response regulator
MNRPPKRIVAAVGDLFFTVKITDAAKRAGLEVDFVKSDQALLEKAKDQPALILLDLNFGAVQPLKVIGKLKGNAEMKRLHLIGYLPPEQGTLKQKAHEAGCNMVLTRAALSQNLPQILKRHAEAP